MKMRKRALSSVLVAAAATLLLTFGVAGPASANSFEKKLNTQWTDVYVSYDDGADRFCLKAHKRPWIDIGHFALSIKPANGVGPSYTYRLNKVDLYSSSKTKCFSLARAYEDSSYAWTVHDFYGEGNAKITNRGSFYS